MNQVYVIYKMDFQYNQQLYKKHYKCKHLEEKKKKLYIFRRQGAAIVQVTSRGWLAQV